MASKRRNMFQKNKTQETTENGSRYDRCLHREEESGQRQQDPGRSHRDSSVVSPRMERSPTSHAYLYTLGARLSHESRGPDLWQRPLRVPTDNLWHPPLQVFFSSAVAAASLAEYLQILPSAARWRQIHGITGVTPRARHGANVSLICEEGSRDTRALASGFESSGVLSLLTSAGMKRLFLLLVLAVAVGGTVIHTRAAKKPGNKETLRKQKTLIRFLYGIGHEHTFKSEFDNFDIVGNAEYYTEPTAVKAFAYAVKNGFLPKHAHFSLTCEKTLDDTIKLFDLFYFAKDFDTFYKTACWARRHVNGVQFIYALYIAVYHRPDCRNIVLPPIYEVFPHFFLTSDVLHKLFDARMEGTQRIDNNQYCDYPQSLKLKIESKRRNKFYQNKKRETTEIGTRNLPSFFEKSSEIRVAIEVNRLLSVRYETGTILGRIFMCKGRIFM
ncbi:hypothetical protein AAG570_002551 [Ranatra chinensis]|uniref:Hemocyanin N-terminal domain-containing protein n=1 Tax=Ranatra chinensis TaxID=642074 RepID=A0ABD0Y894_9HEMI